jgi:hypothetical protein
LAGQLRQLFGRLRIGQIHSSDGFTAYLSQSLFRRAIDETQRGKFC